jgi:putative RecB family exonuclease
MGVATAIELAPIAEPDAIAEPAPAEIVGSLSPSRAADFKTCPLLYRLRTIDRLPEAPSPAATRGTVVHSVLEQLFDLPAPQRTLAAARALVDPSWRRLLDAEPELATLFGDADAGGDGGQAAGPPSDNGSVELLAWLDSARDLLDGYFVLEDPTRFEPVAREQLVEVVVDGLRMRGYIDRLDRSPAGDLRVVDYKTGAAPREAFEGKALFQMKFYALVLWRTHGIVPRQLKLIYLADRDTLSYQPDEEELIRFERTVKAIWQAIATATARRDFRPSPGRLCDWCSFQSLCPAYGGTPPPYPEPAAAGQGVSGVSASSPAR